MQADSDNLEAAKATLKGLKRQHETTGSVPIYINTASINIHSVMVIESDTQSPSQSLALVCP